MGTIKLVLISDTHCQHSALDIPECDILIHAGDWTHRGEESRTVEFLEWFEAQDQCADRLYIGGNHDFMCERDPTKFLELRKRYAPTSTYLEDSSVVINGYKFHGSPVSPWFHSWAFNRQRGADIQKHWDTIPDDTEVLVVHGPPYGYGDLLSEHGSEPGQHIGCANLLNTIDSKLKDLKLVVTGHIHEGAGTYQRGDITMVNAAVLDERYRMKNKPVVISLPDKNPVSDPNKQ